MTLSVFQLGGKQMAAIIALAGLFEILGGVLITLQAQSAIHEILGAVLFGMGTLAVGLSAVIIKLGQVRSDLKNNAAARA